MGIYIPARKGSFINFLKLSKMKSINIPNWLIAIFSLLFSLLVYYFLTDVRNVQSPNGPEQELVDTVWRIKYVPVESYKYSFNPTKLIFFTEKDTVEIERINIIHDTVHIHTKDSSSIYYNSQFLTRYPNTNKLVQLLLDGESLSLSLLNTQGQLSTQYYDLDLDRFSYNYQNEDMTFKKKSFFQRLNPFIETTFRPMNVLMDVNLGICHKTSKIYYELGLNGFYYPLVKPKLGHDFYFKVRYNF